MRDGYRGARGAAAVEFALVVIPLLIIVLGIISYGYMLSFRQSVSQAAKEGARAAAVAPASADRSATAYDAVEQVMGQACGSAYLTCVATPVTGCRMDVTVSYAYVADPSKPTFLVFDLVLPERLDYTSSIEITPARDGTCP